MNHPSDTAALLHRHPRTFLDTVVGPNHGVRVDVHLGPFRVPTEVTFGAAWTLADGTVWRTIAITTLNDLGEPSRRLPRATAEVSVDPASGALRYAGRQVEGGRRGARRFAERVADRVGDRIEAAARDLAVDGSARLSARTARAGRRVVAAAGEGRPAAPTRTERTCVSKA